MRKENWVDSEGAVDTEAFMPDSRTLRARKEGNETPFGEETSINWQDDEGAIEQLRGSGNARFGILRLGTIVLQQNEHGRAAPVLGWERRPQPNNPYHGNILFLECVAKRDKRAAAAAMALRAEILERTGCVPTTTSRLAP